ncbi:DgyrCDS13845 [Dimorphilus gyrociliatus]|uniref:BLOC-1-related complex subunit 7 n=1 Tax=Dimorphilus gyrociliatus TaxID=2664684 RepID=A0A7I8WBW5_9ANNE|nr:DgyrCDS13845 [Dimorphilus gyrociliatus]
MAGSGSKNWHQEIKSRLSEKVANNINDLGSLCKQVSKGSKSLEAIEKTSKNFTLLEGAIENSLTTLKKMSLLSQHLNYQIDAINTSAEQLPDIKNQLETIHTSAT